MHVGIFFNARRAGGGLFQYAVSLVESLAAHGKRHRYTLFHATMEPLPFVGHGPDEQGVVLPPGMEVVTLSRPRKVVAMGLELALMRATRLGLREPVRVVPTYPEIRRAGIDLLLHVKPNLHVTQWDVPSMFPIHDLQHALQPEFPEVTEDGEGARRDFIFGQGIRAARAVLADSNTGVQDIIDVYGADPSKVFALPHIAPPAVVGDVTDAELHRVRVKYSLPECFFFYPAVFWPHKNHLRLVRAIALLRDRDGFHATLALAGGKSGQYQAVVDLVRELGLGDQVRFLGYVPDADMRPLYCMARALVMPTFFGPSNLPNLEAWTLGCPLITSDIRGLREHVADAGLLVNPRQPESIADAMLRLERDPALGEALKLRGKMHVLQFSSERFAERLEAIIDGDATPLVE